MTEAAQGKDRSRPSHFLRAVGLYAFQHLVQFILRGLGFDWTLSAEPPKHVIQTSWGAALARCAVHVLPVLASIAIISLNICHLFLGKTFPGAINNTDVSLALLQIAAKIQELLILSSLSTIVFHCICERLMSDDGLPLGFLCSGFTFSQLSYYWSPDFWGAAKAQPAKGRNFCDKLLYYTHDFRLHKVLVPLLVVAGLIAATAGPSFAVLILPRDQAWVAGGSDFYLRGTRDQLFPLTVSASSLDAPLLCSGPDSILHGFCPAGGFSTLRNYVSQTPMINNGENVRDTLPVRLFGVFNEQSIGMASITRAIPTSILVGSVRGVACQTAVVGSFLPVAMYQRRLLCDWQTVTGDIRFNIHTMSTAEYRYSSGEPFTSTSGIRIPAVRTFCSAAQTLRRGDSDVLFPVIPKNSCLINSTQSYTVAQPEASPLSANLRTTWIALPPIFGATSAGLLFEAPWSTNDSTRLVVGCSIDARWVDGKVEADQGKPDRLADDWKGGRAADLTTRFRPPADNSWDQISLHESWLKLLTPAASPSGIEVSSGNNLNLSGQTTTFDALLAASTILDSSLMSGVNPTEDWNVARDGFANRTIFLEWLTTLLVTDGLSRYGSHRALNISGPPTGWDLLDYIKIPDKFSENILAGDTALLPPSNIVDYTTFKTMITIQGLSYQAKFITDYLSMAVLLIHALVASLHVIYILFWRRRESSAAWDSVTELIALALNSRPALTGVPNISAGIYCFQTFGKRFVIRSTTTTTTTTDVTAPVPMTGSKHDGEEETAERAPKHIELLLRDSTTDLLDSDEDSPNSTHEHRHWTPGTDGYGKRSSSEKSVMTGLLTTPPSLTQQDSTSSQSSSSSTYSSSPPKKPTRRTWNNTRDGDSPLTHGGEIDRILVDRIVPGRVYV